MIVWARCSLCGKEAREPSIEFNMVPTTIHSRGREQHFAAREEDLWSR